MFWQKKRNYADLWLFVFGLIALAIILASVVLLLNLRRHWQEKVSSQNGYSLDLETVLAGKNLTVESNYFAGIQALQTEILGAQKVEDIYQKAEELFFTARVPMQSRDLHLRTFLKIAELKNTPADLTVVKEKINNWLTEILQQ